METLSPEQLADFRDAFHLLDLDGDGQISKSELGNAMRSLGCVVTTEDIQRMMDLVDHDEDGCIDFIEFVTMVTKLMTDTHRSQEHFSNAFELFDKHHDGHIDEDELRFIMNAFFQVDYTARDVQRIIQEADYDGDDVIDLREFIGIMRAGL